MDRAYEDERTRFRAGELGFNPVVPQKRSRVCPWEYAMELYKRRNELERLFRRLKGLFQGIGYVIDILAIEDIQNYQYH
jgi:hypothetical protein